MNQPALNRTFVIRNISVDEAAPMAALSGELFIETFGTLYSPENLQMFLEKVHSLAGVTADMEAGRNYWIAEDDGKWIGFIKSGPVGLPVEAGNRNAVELKQLYVRKEYHGSGVAHSLMKIFMDWAAEQKAEDIYISCWSENARGFAFYKKYGFEFHSKYIFWVGQHADDEWILHKKLV